MKRNRAPSPHMGKLLSALAEDAAAWHYGYPLMKATGLQSGTLYPLLTRMDAQGLVESEWREPEQAGRPARHAYRLTTAGRAMALTLAQRDAGTDEVFST